MTAEVGEDSASFLIRAQGPDGYWREFRTLAGESTHWPTAYVADHLVRAGHDGPHLDRAAAVLLAAQKPDGGWGYNDEVPTDSDSTAYVLLFLLPRLTAHPALERGLRCLAAHQLENGGVATYRAPGPIRSYMGLSPETSLAGWTRPHVEVTAAAGCAFAAAGGRWRERAARAWRYVRERQGSDGLWHSYWWTVPHYPTLQAVRLAAAVAADGAREATDRVTRRLTETQREDGGWSGSPFATALSLHALREGSASPEPARRACRWLRRERRPDGSWTGTPALRIPPPAAVEPAEITRWRHDALGTGVILTDHRRLYTTATCLGALARCRTPAGPAR